MFWISSLANENDSVDRLSWQSRILASVLSSFAPFQHIVAALVQRPRRGNSPVYRTARKIPVTGPEQGSQEDGSDTENSLVAVGASRDAGARDSRRCICDSTASGSRRVVRKRRGKQGNQNSGPRKKSQPDQRGITEGTSACVSVQGMKKQGRGKGRGGGGRKRERSRIGE